MADQLDNRPVFTIVMGCNGAGKSAWKRDNYDRLPEQYFDQDSVAGGIGDWNSEEARQRTRRIVDAEIARAIENRKDFGMESTYSGTPGRAMVKRAKAAGYRIEGVYIGTKSPEINAERIRYRVSANTGHWVDVDRLPQRYGFSLSNLRKTAEQFDTLEIVDNSYHNATRVPEPSEQLVLEQGVVTSRATVLKPWCEKWLQRFERSLAGRQVDQRQNPTHALAGAVEACASKPPVPESQQSWKDRVKSELGKDIRDESPTPPTPPASAAGAAEAARRRGQQRNDVER
jgi:predicted ABC-type ATPase